MEYYYLKGIDKIGPLSEDELLDSDIKLSTQIWTRGMDEWISLSELTELREKFNNKNPPEIPKHIVKLRERHKKIHRNAFNLVVFWTIFHAFALLMSYCEVKIFNSRGLFSTEKFWPFVDFNRTVETGNRTWLYDHAYLYEKRKEFEGIFVNYDYTEFFFYTVLGLILFFSFKRWSKG